MPKMKTRKSLTKRFKVTATGKILHMGCGKSHRMVSFSGKRVRRLRKKRVIASARVTRKLIRGMQAY